eukprot:TRINITY_DN10627_c0_g2_i1.p1 TRINITY_DN10627_c0_g2~~TRINITY_DN10627_c0_g2_i1.p1  ORF type:complete len:1396 (+),score=186.15 TRINITY_DN10627_c0_g2_i1:135-4322(+)
MDYSTATLSRGGPQANITNHPHLAFGFLPAATHDVLEDANAPAEDRSSAITTLRASLQSLPDNALLLEYLQEILSFLIDLTSDTNLKVCMGAVDTIGQLTSRVGWPMRGHLDHLMTTLINMLGESKIVVRQCVTKVINKLMATLTPDPVLKKLASSVRHRSWRVREELTNIIILALSKYSPEQIDLPAIFKQLATLLTDRKSRVQYVAIEAMAVMQRVIGDEAMGKLLQTISLPERVGKSLIKRLENTAQLPAVNDGVVEHLQRLSSSASSTSSTMSAMSASYSRNSAFPWTSRPTSSHQDNLSSATASRTQQSTYSTPSSSATHSARKPPSTGSYADLYKAKLESRSSTSHTLTSATSSRASTREEPSSYLDMWASKRSTTTSSRSHAGDAEASTYQPTLLSKASGQSIKDSKGRKSYNSNSIPFLSSQQGTVVTGLSRTNSTMRANKHSSKEMSLASGSYATQHVKAATQTAPKSKPISEQGRATKPKPALITKLAENPPSAQPAAVVPEATLPKVVQRDAQLRHLPKPRLLKSIFPDALPDDPPKDEPEQLDPVRKPANKPKKVNPSASTKPCAIATAQEPSNSQSTNHSKSGNNQLSSLEKAPKQIATEPAGQSVETSDSGSDVKHAQPRQARPRQLRLPNTKRGDSSHRVSIEPLAATKGHDTEVTSPAHALVIKPSETNTTAKQAHDTVDHGSDKPTVKKHRPKPHRPPTYPPAKVDNPDLNAQQTVPQALSEPSLSPVSPNASINSSANKLNSQQSSQPSSRRVSQHPSRAPSRQSAGSASSQANSLHTSRAPSPLDVASTSQGPPSPAPCNGNATSTVPLDSVTHGSHRASADTISDSRRLSPTKAKKVRKKTPIRRTPLPSTGSMTGFESTLTQLDATQRAPQRSAGGKGGTDAHLVALDDLPPLKISASEALSKAHDSLDRGSNQETWMEKCEGLNLLRRLLVHEPDFVVDHMKEIIDAAVLEVGNLRSSVSRLAILLLGDLYAELPKPVEKHLTVSVAALQRKSGAEASAFIREDVDRALGVMVYSVHPVKSLNALLPTADSKISHVRSTAARFLAESVGRIGDRVLEVRDTEKLIRTTASLIQDQHAETRQHARKLLFLLASLDAFEGQYTKVLSGSALRAVESAVATLRKKGLEQVVGSQTSAMNITRRAKSSSATSRSRSATGRKIPSDTVKTLGGQLSAKDWKKREQACKDLVELITKSPAAFLASGVNLLFDFVPLLTDSNSKVNAYALECLCDIIPMLQSGMEPVLAEALPAIAQSLSSKNSNIRSAAQKGMEMACQFIELSALAPALSAMVLKGTPVSNEAVLPHLIALCDGAQQDERSHKALQKHMVKVAVRLHQDQRLRTHTADLWRALHQALGEILLSHKALKGDIVKQLRSIL